MPIRCPICLDGVELSQLSDLASLPCGHVFHEKCICDWLLTSGTCPKCRVIVPSRFSVSKLFMDVDAPGDDSMFGGGACGGVGSTPSCNLHCPNEQKLFALLGESQELRDNLVVQEQLLTVANANTATVQKTLQKKTLDYDLRGESINRLQQDLEKKKQKLEADMILKNKLRADNKELRQIVREQKKTIAGLDAGMATLERNADLTRAGMNSMKKDVAKLGAKMESFESNTLVPAKKTSSTDLAKAPKRRLSASTQGAAKRRAPTE